MTTRVEWGRPKKLNAVSVTLILMLLAGCYWMWRFFPFYFDGWTVDHILKESASQVYRANRLREPERTETLRSIVNKARSDIRTQANITDPELAVNLEILDKTAAMSAEYTVVVTHPLVTRTTVLHFVKRETANIKEVKWD